MVLNRSIIASVFSAAAIAALGGAAQAQTFSFVNTTTPDPFAGTNGASVDVLQTSGTVNPGPGVSTTDIVLFNLNNISTNLSTNSGTINVTFNTNVAFTSGGQTINQGFTGTFSGIGVSTTSGDYSSSIPGTQPGPLNFNFSNGNQVVLNNFTFTAPGVVGGGIGGVTATATLRTVSTAPEPGTLALLGTGALGTVGMVARRRRAAK